MKRQTARAWDFWIDRGGTFTDVIGRDPRGRAARAQAAVGEPGLSPTPRCRRSATCSASPPARRSRPARSASSRWAPRSPPTRCSSARASARCWSTTTGFRDALRDRLPGAARRSSPATSSSPSSSMRASSRSTSACAPTEPSKPRPISPRCAPSSRARKARRLRRGRHRLHARLSLSRSTSGMVARARARARLRPGLGQPRMLAADQARRRAATPPSSTPICRRSCAAMSTRVSRALDAERHRRAGHVHDVVGRPDRGGPVRRQGRDPVRAGGRRGRRWRETGRERRLSARSSASTWAAPRPTSRISTANTSAPSRPRSRACACARR